MVKEQEEKFVEALVAKQMGEQAFAQFAELEREILSDEFAENFSEDFEPVLERF